MYRPRRPSSRESGFVLRRFSAGFALGGDAGFQQVAAFPLRVERSGTPGREGLPIVEMIESFELPKA
jgi:hypothetical protein